jgi:hypothetical protein
MMVNNATNMNNYPVGAVRCVTCGKHIYDCFISSRFEVYALCFISSRFEVYAHKTSLILPLFIEVPMLSQESERSCICLLEVSILFVVGDGTTSEGGGITIMLEMEVEGL